jgi:hypothetical protein
VVAGRRNQRSRHHAARSHQEPAEHRGEDLAERSGLQERPRAHAEHPSEEVAASWFRAYFRELARPSNPEQRARAETFRRENARLVAQLVSNASPEQRAHLDKRLSGFAAEFMQLASRNHSG